MEDDNNNDALIGKIYETALSPGDWVELLDTIAGGRIAGRHPPIPAALWQRDRLPAKWIN